MTLAAFVVDTSIRSVLSLDELNGVTGVKARRYHPTDFVLPNGRVDEQSLWQYEQPLRTNSVSEELRSAVAWLSTFMPDEALEVVITILLPSGGGATPITLDGDVVADILDLGASLDFDDVLVTGDDEVDSVDRSGRPLCRFAANTLDLGEAATRESRDVFLDEAAAGKKVAVVVEDWEPYTIIADLVRAGVREMVLATLGPWPAIVFERAEFPATRRDWRLILRPSR